ECESLAAAAPEIDVTTWTARARLLHPCGAAEGVEGRRVCPDIGERSLAHVPEFKSGNRLGRVAGQHLARRCHVEGSATPMDSNYRRQQQNQVGLLLDSYSVAFQRTLE